MINHLFAYSLFWSLNILVKVYSVDNVEVIKLIEILPTKSEFVSKYRRH